MLSLVNRQVIVVRPSDSVETCNPSRSNGNEHTGSYPGYEWMACIEKDTHELGRPLLLELVTPSSDIIHSVKFSVGSKGVGDAHSSYDRWDNITHQERRGITIAIASKEKRTVHIVNRL